MDISVTRFRASCLELIRRVETGGESVDIKRRGKVVARLAPHRRSRKRRASRGSGFAARASCWQNPAIYRVDALVAALVDADSFKPRYQTDEPNGPGCGEHVFASASLDCGRRPAGVAISTVRKVVIR